MRGTVAAEAREVVGYRPPTIRWSAVFGGWLVATGLAWLMYVLGLAVGFTAIDAADVDASMRSLGIGTAVWLLLTWAVSLFLGGMYASWLDGKTDSGVGTLHGVAVWALATTVTVMLVALGFSNLLQGGASLIRGMAAAGGMAAGSAGQTPGGVSDPVTGGLQAELKHQVAQAMARSAQGGTATAATQEGSASAGASKPAAEGGAQVDSGQLRRAMDQIDAQTTASVAADLIRGNTDRAKTRLAAGTSLSRAEVDQVMQGMAQQVERAKGEAKEAADKAAKYSSAAMWAVFVSSLIGLLAAALGGWMGASNVSRVYDTDVL
jgi:hypothetical protein